MRTFQLRTLLIAAYLAIVAPVSYAGDAVLTWEAPTTNTDDSPIPPTGPGSLAGWKLYYNIVGDTTESVVTIPDPALRTYTVTGLPFGSWEFELTAYNVENVESDRSNKAFRDFVQDAKTPTPPGFTFVTVATPVYNVVKKTNGFVLLIVGSVPLNTPCDRTQTVNGFNAVPTSLVTWTGVRTNVVVAKCSVK